MWSIFKKRTSSSSLPFHQGLEELENCVRRQDKKGCKQLLPLVERLTDEECAEFSKDPAKMSALNYPERLGWLHHGLLMMGISAEQTLMQWLPWESSGRSWMAGYVEAVSLWHGDRKMGLGPLFREEKGMEVLLKPWTACWMTAVDMHDIPMMYFLLDPHTHEAPVCSSVPEVLFDHLKIDQSTAAKNVVCGPYNPFLLKDLPPNVLRHMCYPDSQRGDHIKEGAVRHWLREWESSIPAKEKHALLDVLIFNLHDDHWGQVLLAQMLNEQMRPSRELRLLPALHTVINPAILAEWEHRWGNELPVYEKIHVLMLARLLSIQFTLHDWGSIPNHEGCIQPDHLGDKKPK